MSCNYLIPCLVGNHWLPCFMAYQTKVSPIHMDYLGIYLQCRRCGRYGFDPWIGKIPWRRKWQFAPIFLPGKFHEQRNLVVYSP